MAEGVAGDGMAVSNPLAVALSERRFCYVVELVASGLRREAQVLEVASRLAGIPEVVAGSITSYAGGAIGHDPIRVGTAARARGLTPNIHVTCVSQDRRGLEKTLEDLQALGIGNVFALTGDYPKAGAGQSEPVFDLDSVQLVRMIAERRRAGAPFHVAVAVSPFKYVEADCVYQYLKLEKKLAAGADCAITQVGWDARKFRELKRYLDERGLRPPLLGNVYVLGPRAAQRMAGGEPPGCWVSPALLAQVQAESTAPDKGIRARLERAARTAAVLRGLGYAGAYIGGTHDAVQVAWIIRRAHELAPRWEELADELDHGDRDGFYLYADDRRFRLPPASPAPEDRAPASPAPEGPPPASSADEGRAPALPARERPTPPPLPPPRHRPPPWSRAMARALDALGRAAPVTRDTWMRRVLVRGARWADARPAAARAVERLELAIKQPLFGCEACGNCVLGHMEYVCPQTCPKQMRNGPCGGTLFGRCEVVDQPCIWTEVYARAKAAGRIADLGVYIPPPDRALRGESSWITYFLSRDRRPGREAATPGAERR